MRCAVAVFAKAPLPGLAKTRLAAALGEPGAAQLALRLLRHAVQQAVQADVGPVSLCVTPDAADPRWPDWCGRPGIEPVQQSDGDLGQRMDRALQQLLREHPAALLIGTDAPALDAVALRRAAQALERHDAVFGPVADGGYVLVGLRRPQSALFAGMRWSHDQVMAQTRQRLTALGLSHAELPRLHDVDEPADLVHLPAGWIEGGPP